MSDLKEFYRNEVIPALQKEFKYKNINEVPKIVKITINMGVGEAAQDKKAIEGALKDLAAITGQKPIVTYAKKAVAGFKIRAGWPIGAKVTLRGQMMYEFLDRLISIAIPRIRDFRGFSAKSFDGQGNYNMGLAEQIVFAEVEYDKIDKLRGMDISFTTTAKTNEEGQALFKAFNFPLK